MHKMHLSTWKIQYRIDVATRLKEKDSFSIKALKLYHIPQWFST
jgi:hypothetical protein